MLIGVISDTHIPAGAKKLPESIFKYFKGVDLIIHAGDLISMSVLDDLRQITAKVEAVAGNMDPAEVRALLPVKKMINANGKKIAVIHGWGPPGGMKERVWTEIKQDRPDIVIFGHTHKPENTMDHGVLFLNPGSPTDKEFATGNSIAILKIEKNGMKAEIIKL